MNSRNASTKIVFFIFPYLLGIIDNLFNCEEGKMLFRINST
jgi:hypothetical protein